MGRTLHYTLTKSSGNLTKREHQIMIDIANKYNSGRFAEVWTCENYYFTAYNYYPNWNTFKNGTSKDAWEIVNKRFDELVKQGKQQIEIYEILYKEKLILYHREIKTNKVRGFTKTQGNEFNSLLVYSALIEVSEKIPSCEIELHDEGEFLFCDVIIKQGKVKPKVSEIKENIQRWLADLYEIKEGEITLIGLPETIKQELDLGTGKRSYNDCALGYLQTEINNLKDLLKKIKPELDKQNIPLFLYNIENRFYDPILCCREVKPEDFVGEYEEGAKNLMDGFHGEYFGLSQGDSEKESFDMIAMIQKALGTEYEMEILKDVTK